MPIVTVVIAAFNASAFVRGAIGSVLAQSLCDLELIVVDDGSADATRAVAASIRDPRLRVLASHHDGPSAARNLGWRMSSGSRYVAFLDADDRWDADKLRSQVALLDENPQCVATGALMRYVSASGRVLGRAGQLLTPQDRSRIARGELFPFQLSSLVVRTVALAQTGGFDEALGRLGSEDLDLLAKLARVGEIACVPCELGSYRIHQNSAMARHRMRINQAARFVRKRLAARDEGRELTWDVFAQSEARTWAELQQDAVESCYRAAALWAAEGRSLRSLAYGGAALLINPRYTLARLYRQRFARIPARATAR